MQSTASVTSSDDESLDQEGAVGQRDHDAHAAEPGPGVAPAVLLSSSCRPGARTAPGGVPRVSDAQSPADRDGGVASPARSISYHS